MYSVYYPDEHRYSFLKNIDTHWGRFTRDNLCFPRQTTQMASSCTIEYPARAWQWILRAIDLT